MQSLANNIAVPLTFSLTEDKTSQLSERDQILVRNLELVELNTPQLIPPPATLVKLIAIRCRHCKNINECRPLSHVVSWYSDVLQFSNHFFMCQATPESVKEQLREAMRNQMEELRNGNGVANGHGHGLMNGVANGPANGAALPLQALASNGHHERPPQAQLEPNNPQRPQHLSLQQFCLHLNSVYGLRENRTLNMNADGSYGLQGITGVKYGASNFEAEAIPSQAEGERQQLNVFDVDAEGEENDTNNDNAEDSSNRNYRLAPVVAFHRR